MKKFQFSLDTVLNYRQQVLDGVQNEYASLMLKVRQQEEKLRLAEQEYSDLNQEFRRAESEGISIAEAMRFDNGLRFLEQKIRREEKLLEECRNRAEEKRKQLIAARQDTLSLENLRAKKLEAYQKDLQKMEERSIDEMISAARTITTDVS